MLSMGSVLLGRKSKSDQSMNVRHWSGTFMIVFISFRGKCFNCKENLERFALTSNDLLQLREALVSNAIFALDINHQTSDREFEQFQKFIAKYSPFDYVIDALNICYYGGKFTPELVRKHLEI